jgi:hypothetical protein
MVLNGNKTHAMPINYEKPNLIGIVSVHWYIKSDTTALRILLSKKRMNAQIIFTQLWARAVPSNHMLLS